MQDLLSFKDKVVFITGSTSGIGRIAAKLFAEYGAKVIINSRSHKDIDVLTNELVKQNYLAMGIKADVGDLKEVLDAVEKVLEKFGRVDILINNAAVRKMGLVETIERVKEFGWDEMMRTNLKGTFNMCRAVMPVMKKQRSGCIINIASQAAAFVPRLVGIPYITSKGGVISFTKGLAKEVGEFNIRVNAIIPGFIQANKSENRMAHKDTYFRVLDSINLRRFGLPDEVAKVCLFLSSDMASYITGEIIAVNGGMPSVLFL